MNLVLALTLENRAATQYTGWNFDSVCNFAGKTLAAGPDGLFALEGDTDSGDTIAWSAELPLLDMGQSRLRRIVAGGEFAGNVSFAVSADEGTSRSFTLTLRKAGQVQQGGEVAIDRDGKGRYWGVKASGSADFSLDSLEVHTVSLSRRPRG